MSDCTICRTEQHGTRNAFTACQPCEDWTRDQLNAIEHLWQDLPDHLHRGASSGGPRVSGGAVEAPMPVSEAALDLLGPGGVPDRLAPYYAEILETRGLAVTPVTGSVDHRLATLIRHLRRHLPWAAEHVDLYDLAVTLRALVGEMRAATKQHSGTTALGAPCPECSGNLRYDPDTRVVRCDGCGYRRAFTDPVPRAA